MNLIQLLYRSTRRVINIVSKKKDYIITCFHFKCLGVKYKDFRTGGVPYIQISRDSMGLIIGSGFAMNNGYKHNPIGMAQPCIFFIEKNCSIHIGNNVGISQTALIAHANIKIGNNVKIGGGCCVYTSNFHSLDPRVRCTSQDRGDRISAPVEIYDNVFIGAGSIILKGVTIGENTIIGAGSVVTKSVPANQIWGGNPAKFIRNL